MWSPSETFTLWCVPVQKTFYTLIWSGSAKILHSDMARTSEILHSDVDRNLKNFTLWCGPDLEIFYTLMCSGTDNFLHSDVFRTCEIFTLWCGPELEKFYTLMWTGTEKKLHSDMVHPYRKQLRCVVKLRRPLKINCVALGNCVSRNFAIAISQKTQFSQKVLELWYMDWSWN